MLNYENLEPRNEERDADQRHLIEGDSDVDYSGYLNFCIDRYINYEVVKHDTNE